MRILIACEESGTVRDSFTALGHYALSCDLKPSKSPGNHYQGDVFDIINEDWDLMVAFPPCTYLAKAQQWRYLHEPNRIQLRDQAIDFAKSLFHSNIPSVVLENPAGYLSTGFRPYSQLIRPWWFGDPYDKEICLWFKNVPPVLATCYNPLRKKLHNHVNGRMSQEQKSEIKSSWSYFPRMSAALAQQWSNVLSPLACPLSHSTTKAHSTDGSI
jgi:hypothetical protein